MTRDLAAEKATAEWSAFLQEHSARREAAASKQQQDKVPPGPSSRTPNRVRPAAPPTHRLARRAGK